MDSTSIGGDFVKAYFIAHAHPERKTRAIASVIADRALGLFGLIALQIMLGFARVLTVHVPLGVAIILLAVLLVIWAWRPHHGPGRYDHGWRDTIDLRPAE